VPQLYQFFLLLPVESQVVVFVRLLARSVNWIAFAQPASSLTLGSSIVQTDEQHLLHSSDFNLSVCHFQLFRLSRWTRPFNLPPLPCNPISI
jgi:hypothetical protein